MTVQTLAIVVLLVSFFVMIFLRFPIAYAVGLSSVLCLMVQGQALTDVCRLMVKGISSFSLMAVPFFITMGVLMGSGGISEKLIALADACVGWMRGGMAMVNIVASYFFGGISGSASADTASIGSIMIPMMVDQGYDADFSTAVTITSSCEGLLVPPSHNMVIYATTAGGISVGSLFLAGYLPGALLAIVLMIGSYIISVKENYPKGSPFTIKGFIKQLGTSIWALAAVVIVVFGVVGGVFTATESAAIAVIYSLLVSVFVYKGLDWKGVWYALDECVNTLSIVLILIATSAVFGNCLTMLHVPDLAANAITSVTSNPYIIALLIDLIILVLGCIMDMAPIILIATPILLPIATSIGIDSSCFDEETNALLAKGIDPIQFGIIMVLNCGIGLLTPPVGAVLFIGSAVAKRPMEKVVKATLPFYLCMFIALLLLTYVPDISLAIPKLLGGYVSPITNPLGPVFIH
jgi:tripartite ATP-independent transporter DctM subunit